MVKCVVSGCPNRQPSGTRAPFSRTAKRFFKFPDDPARVKVRLRFRGPLLTRDPGSRVQVWLAALRETDRQDPDPLICEDHFLPDDLTSSGVTDDAIPLMPPDPDGALGLAGSWAADSSDGEDQWDTGGGGDDDGEPEPEPEPPGQLQGPVETSLTWSAAEQASEQPERRSDAGDAPGADLGPLALGVLELLLSSPDRSLDLRQAALDLHASRRQVCDIVSVLEGVGLVDRTKGHVRWTSPGPVSAFLWRNPQDMVAQLTELKTVEETLDRLIKTCSWQLFQMTDDPGHASLAYVTRRDLSRLATFQDQTLFLVKAPEETKLEVPAPTEDSIQIHLKGVRGPIVVLTCDPVADDKTSDFTPLEQSRVRTRALDTDEQPAGGAVSLPRS